MKILSVTLALLFLVGCSSLSDAKKKPPAPPPSGGWVFKYSPAMPVGANPLAFDFPQFQNRSNHTDGVHYAVRAAPPVAQGQTITLAFTLVGNGLLKPTEGPTSARVRLFLQRQGDRLSASEEHKRWWSTATVELVSPGNYVLTARVLPGEWTNVFGKNSADFPTQFAECVRNLGNVGFTFGGMFAGHGVYAVGPVRFTATYGIQ